MLKKGDKVYTFNNNGYIASPVEGTVVDIQQDPECSGIFNVNLELPINVDDGFKTVRISGVYTPGATRTKGGSEYVEIDHNDNRFNCYLYLDRIYNLQLCVKLSVLRVNNAKYYCNEVLKELRSLGQEPPKDVIEMMNRFGLE